MRNLIEALSRGWLMEENIARSYMPYVVSILKGESFDNSIFIEKSNKAYSIDKNGVKQGSIAEGKDGSIAVITIQGVMMKKDGWCSKGTATIASQIELANRSNNIKSIILHVDSGGGSVDGTETLYNTVKNSKKPIVAYVDGMAASAAYWSISPSSEIILSGETSSVGSIGTMISLADASGYWKEQGVNFHVVRASRSKDKNEDFYQLLEGNYEPIVQNTLDPLNNIFLQSVKRERKGKIDLKKEDVLTGKMYIGNNAVGVGLADSIGSWAKAVRKADILGNKYKKNSLTKKSANMKKFKIGALTISVSEEDLAEMTAEQKQEMEGNLEKAQNDVDSLKTENATLSTKVEEQGQEIARLEAELEQAKNATEAANAKVEQLEAEKEQDATAHSALEQEVESLKSDVSVLEAANKELSEQAGKDPLVVTSSQEETAEGGDKSLESRDVKTDAVEFARQFGTESNLMTE